MMIFLTGNDSGGECGVTVSRLFPMSGTGPESNLAEETGENGHRPAPPFWYSYNYGSVHFTTLSSEHDLTSGSKQIKVRSLLGNFGNRCILICCNIV